MSADFRPVARECAKASKEERISFADVVGKLIEAGVERYHVDFVRGETSYFTPAGEVEVVQTPMPAAPARDFSAADIAAAVRGAQSGELQYPAFCEKALAAGCVGYIVSMAGKRVVYLGRTSDMHIEWFPGAR